MEETGREVTTGVLEDVRTHFCPRYVVTDLPFERRRLRTPISRSLLQNLTLEF